MVDWPDIEAPTEIEERPTLKAFRSRSEAGYVQTRDVWTSGKLMPVTLHWSAMTTADKVTLRTFFYTNRSVAFNWTHPDELTSHVCVFSNDDFRCQASGDKPGRYVVSVDIEEQQ